MIIIIPLHQSLDYPCDYIDQTAKILSKKNSVIFFDYYYPYSWNNMLKVNNLKALFNSFSDILKLKKIIYFRAPAILPFSKLKIIIHLNKKIGFFILSIFFWLLKRKVIIWQFYPLITKKIFKNQFCLYDCIDYINLDDQTRKFFYEEKATFLISNLLVFNSKRLFEEKLKTNSILKNKSIVTVCGCNNKLFNTRIKNIPREFINIPQKKIIFMGIFDYRVDVKLLHYIVKSNRDLKFIFIGLIRENVADKFYKIIKEKNVLYLGKKRKNDLVAYLKNSDLGIIPYSTKSEFVRYSNPMKFYEYLASGLPVVSTDILALEDYPKGIVYTTNNKEEFSQAIRRLMDDWNDEKITIAKNIAEKNSWENKITTIEKNIYPHSSNKVDVIINVYGKPWQTLCTLKSLMEHSKEHIDRIYFIEEKEQPYEDKVDWVKKYFDNVIGYKPSYYQFMVHKIDFQNPEMRYGVRYQYGIEKSDKKYIFLTHNDVLYTGDIIGNMLNEIDNNVGIGQIGQCWNCPANVKGLCDGEKFYEYSPSYEEIISCYNEVKKSGLHYIRTNVEMIDENNPLPLLECRLNEWACLINREVYLKECWPNGTTSFIGMGDYMDIGISWFRSLHKKGYKFKNYTKDFVHGQWANNNGGHTTQLNKEAYIFSELKAKEYYKKLF